MDKDVRVIVSIPQHQVGGEGLEGDETTPGADGWVQAAEVPLVAIGVHTHPSDDAGAAIMDKDVKDRVGVTLNQIRGGRVEGDKTPLAADRGVPAVIIPLATGAINADPGGAAGAAVMDKDVDDAVGVVQYQVRGGGEKGDEAPVGADGGIEAMTVPLAASAVHADPGSDSGVAIMDEDV